MTRTRGQPPRKSPRALAQELEGELVLIQVDSGNYYTLGEVGGRVWALCDGTHSPDEVVAAIVAEFDASPDEIDADVRALLADLIRERLLVEFG